MGWTEDEYTQAEPMGAFWSGESKEHSSLPNVIMDEVYSEKYLNHDNSLELMGYDWCAEEVVDSFFDNLDVYYDEDPDFLAALNKQLPNDLKDSYTFNNHFSSERPEEKRSIETVGDLLRFNMLHWIEIARNEMITSMLDNTSKV